MKLSTKIQACGQSPMREFSQPVLYYAPSPGMSGLIAAVQAYYQGIDMTLEPADSLVMTGGSEALIPEKG